MTADAAQHPYYRIRLKRRNRVDLHIHFREETKEYFVSEQEFPHCVFDFKNAELFVKEYLSDSPDAIIERVYATN